MEAIFSDFEPLVLEKDLQAPGVFLKVRKPEELVAKDLSGYQLYNVVLKKRVAELTDDGFDRLEFVILNLKERPKKRISFVVGLVLWFIPQD